MATPETAKAIESLGIEVSVVNKLREDNSIMDLVESGQLDYIVYTGKSDKKSIADYIKLHNRAESAWNRNNHFTGYRQCHCRYYCITLQGKQTRSLLT